MTITSERQSGNTPEQVNDDLWVFPPNQFCNGGTAWWLSCSPEPVLVDCPPLTNQTIKALEKLSEGKKPKIVLTNREGHGQIASLQAIFRWPVLVQEQEAYLLPGITKLDTFSEESITLAGLKLLWTPGPSPGSCVMHAPHPWNVLFCGRLLIPVSTDSLAPVRNRRTFHWGRLQKSLQKLQEWIPPESSPLLASGAPLSKLMGAKLVGWEASKSAFKRNH